MTEPTPPTSTTCLRCGKPIAEALIDEAYCCLCRYGDVNQHERQRPPDDMVSMMQQHDRKWLAGVRDDLEEQGL